MSANTVGLPGLFQDPPDDYREAKSVVAKSQKLQFLVFFSNPLY